jgi:hypothetical protein
MYPEGDCRATRGDSASGRDPLLVATLSLCLMVERLRLGPRYEVCPEVRILQASQIAGLISSRSPANSALP